MLVRILRFNQSIEQPDAKAFRDVEFPDGDLTQSFYRLRDGDELLLLSVLHQLSKPLNPQRVRCVCFAETDLPQGTKINPCGVENCEFPFSFLNASHVDLTFADEDSIGALCGVLLAGGSEVQDFSKAQLKERLGDQIRDDIQLLGTELASAEETLRDIVLRFASCAAKWGLQR